MDKNIQFQDISGFYTDEGQGRAVILIHGFCVDSSIWEPIGKKLKENFRVIVPDLPGYRKSSLPQQLSIESMAEFVCSIIKKEKIEKPMVIGHSMGGYITLAMVEKYPDLAERIGLFHSFAFSDDDEKKKNRTKAKDFVTKNGTMEFVEGLYNNLFSENFLADNPERISQLKDQAKLYPAGTITAGLQAMRDRPDRIKVLEDFKGPVLFILGKYDKAIPQEKSLEQCKFPDVSIVHILQKSGHMGMIEEPEKSLNIILEFSNLKVSI